MPGPSFFHASKPTPPDVGQKGDHDSHLIYQRLPIFPPFIVIHYPYID